MREAPLPLQAYRIGMNALNPLVPHLLRHRMKQNKEDPARIRERLGHPALPRPSGQLIWVHAASVGESLSVLPLIDGLLRQPDRHVLVTTGTLTSARIVADRLPARAMHQFVPVDVPAAVRRFLDWWRPDAALFVDSEIWPNLLGNTHERGIPLALINGRMSSRSFLGWRRLKKTSAAVLQCFDVCLAQDDESAARFTKLGAKNVVVSGNLKADAPPLPADGTTLHALKAVIGDRPVFLAASTHRGEEETLLPAQDILRSSHPDLLTIIAPRHPERGPDIVMLCGTRKALQRSAGALPTEDTEIYVCDTLGELGLLYRLSPFAFVGGSLVPHGGQNPLEPARLERAVMAGPHTHNFSPAYAAIFAAQGVGPVGSSTEIAGLAARWLADPEEARVNGVAAFGAALQMGGAVRHTLEAVEALIPHARA